MDRPQGRASLSEDREHILGRKQQASRHSLLAGHLRHPRLNPLGHVVRPDVHALGLEVRLRRRPVLLLALAVEDLVQADPLLEVLLDRLDDLPDVRIHLRELKDLDALLDGPVVRVQLHHRQVGALEDGDLELFSLLLEDGDDVPERVLDLARHEAVGPAEEPQLTHRRLDVAHGPHRAGNRVEVEHRDRPGLLEVEWDRPLKPLLYGNGPIRRASIHGHGEGLNLRWKVERVVDVGSHDQEHVVPDDRVERLGESLHVAGQRVRVLQCRGRAAQASAAAHAGVDLPVDHQVVGRPAGPVELLLHRVDFGRHAVRLVLALQRARLELIASLDLPDRVAHLTGDPPGILGLLGVGVDQEEVNRVIDRPDDLGVQARRLDQRRPDAASPLDDRLVDRSLCVVLQLQLVRRPVQVRREQRALELVLVIADLLLLHHDLVQERVGDRSRRDRRRRARVDLTDRVLAVEDRAKDLNKLGDLVQGHLHRGLVDVDADTRGTVDVALVDEVVVALGRLVELHRLVGVVLKLLLLALLGLADLLDPHRAEASQKVVAVRSDRHYATACRMA